MFKSIKIGSITPILMGLLGGLKGQIAISKVITPGNPAYPYITLLIFGSYIGSLAGSCITWLFASAIYGIVMQFLGKEYYEYKKALTVVGISLVPLLLIQCLDLLVAFFSYPFPFTLFLLLSILAYTCMFSLVRKFSLDLGYCNKFSIVGGIIAPVSYYFLNFAATIISLWVGGSL